MTCTVYAYNLCCGTLSRESFAVCLIGRWNVSHSLKSEYSIRNNKFSSGTESLYMCPVILKVHFLSEFQALFSEIKPN